MSDSSTNPAEDLAEKKVSRNSPVWRFFGYFSSDKLQINPVCKLCRKHVPSKTGNTTNLYYHVKQCHPIEHAQLQEARGRANVPSTSSKPLPQQQTLETAFSSVIMYVCVCVCVCVSGVDVYFIHVLLKAA